VGKHNGPYDADFPKGTIVRVASQVELEEFRATWKLHNPLKQEQLAFAGSVAKVVGVGYYFGGDELYRLEGIPGVWHECCLEPVE
jgi:hypothetical protein